LFAVHRQRLHNLQEQETVVVGQLLKAPVLRLETNNTNV